MKRRLRKLLLAAVLVVVVNGLLITTATYGKGQNQMEILYDVKDAKDLKPEIYHTNTDSIALFPVPQSNAVGTNDCRDAITIISFSKGNLEFREYFKKAVSSLSGGGEYLPVISPDVIGFGQMRRFLLFDVKNMKHEQYGIVFSIDETIEKIAIADADRRRFIFEIKEYDRHSGDDMDFAKSLQLIDLSAKKVNLIKRLIKEPGSIWCTAHNKVFLWYFDEKIMQVYDMNLVPSAHELGDFIMKNRDKLDFSRIAPHPTLPFAIVFGGQRLPDSVISWKENGTKASQPFIDSGDYYSFSPDGKWVTFLREDFNKRKKLTYIMPVSEKYPHYLGSPILLSGDYFDEKYFAWTTNPIGFVGSGLRYIYRWELTNEAHPESDRPTFHDYIVEKDLEKLAKESKQGLRKEDK